MQKVRKVKMELKPVTLCQGLDKSIQDMLMHGRSLSFDQTPDYHILRKSIRAGLERLRAK